jgi:hypothetical protein
MALRAIARHITAGYLKVTRRKQKGNVGRSRYSPFSGRRRPFIFVVSSFREVEMMQNTQFTAPAMLKDGM